uniref:Concanavalin A-like lectin/glucanase domain-containing protein n=1 Tax=Panagrellus redivivus TaxID=6233 RepID=A0A7E4UV27_PANRE
MPNLFNWILLVLFLNLLNVANGEYILADADTMSSDLKDMFHKGSKWWISLNAALKEPIKICPIYGKDMSITLDFFIPPEKTVTNGQINLRYAVYNGWEMHPFVAVTDGQHTRFYYGSKTQFSVSSLSSHYFRITQYGTIEHSNADTGMDTKAVVYGKFILDQAAIEGSDQDCLPIELSWDGFPDGCTVSFDSDMLAVPEPSPDKDKESQFRMWIVLVSSFLGAGTILSIALLIVYLGRLGKRAKLNSTKTGPSSNTKTK